MAREVICQWCKNKSPKDEMEIHNHLTSTGNVKPMNFHKECLPLYLEDRAIKDKEQEDKLELITTMQRLHRLDVFPHTFLRDYIEPLRNGTFKMGKKVVKKKGIVSYKLMTETYLFIEHSIDYARKNIKYDNATRLLAYTFSIMINKLPVVKKKMRQEEFAKEVAEKHNNITQSQDDIAFAEREIKFNKKSNGGVDMSKFLD